MSKAVSFALEPNHEDEEDREKAKDGFRKMTRFLQGTLSKGFWHANFRRDHPELLHLVQRKHKDYTKSEDLTQVLSSVHELKGKHEGIINDISSLKHENEMLRKEVAQLQWKSCQQEHVLNKVMHFIAHMIYQQGTLLGNSVPRKRQALSIMPPQEGPVQKMQRQTQDLATIGDITDSTDMRMLEAVDKDQQHFDTQSPSSMMSGDYRFPVTTSLPTEYTLLKGLSSVASGSQKDVDISPPPLEMLSPLSTDGKASHEYGDIGSVLEMFELKELLKRDEDHEQQIVQ